MLGCSLLFLFGAIALLLSLYSIYKRESGQRIIFTPLLLFCINELTFVWPATIFARSEGISQDYYASVVILTSAFAFIAGYVFLRNNAKWSASGPVLFWSKPLLRPNEASHFIAVLLCAAVFMLLGLYLYQGLPPAITGMQEFLRHGYASGINDLLSERRLELTKGHFFGGEYRGQGAIRVLLRTGWPFLATIALVLFLRKRQSLWKFVSTACFLACFVYIGGDGTRGPFLWAMITILVAVSYYARFRLRTLVRFGIIILLGIVLLSLPQKLSKVAANGGDWRDGVQQLAERLFTGNGINTIHVIEYARSGQLELRLGSIHATDIAAALPFIDSGVPFTYELFLLQNPDAKSSRTTLSSMTYLGCLYGDFGWPGAILGFFILGAGTALCGQVLFKRSKTVANVTVVGMTVMSIGQLNLNGIVHSSMSLLVLFFVAKLYGFCLSMTLPRHQPLSRQLARPVRSSVR